MAGSGWERALEAEIADQHDNSFDLSSPGSTMSPARQPRPKTGIGNSIRQTTNSTPQHYFEMVDGQAKAAVYDTTAMRDVFLQACNSSIRPHEMALAAIGPFLLAQQLVVVCKALKMLEPEGPLSLMMVGIIYSTNKTDDEADGITFSQFLDVLVEIAFEVKQNVGKQLEELYMEKKEAMMEVASGSSKIMESSAANLHRPVDSTRRSSHTSQSRACAPRSSAMHSRQCRFSQSTPDNDGDVEHASCPSSFLMASRKIKSATEQRSAWSGRGIPRATPNSVSQMDLGSLGEHPQQGRAGRTPSASFSGTGLDSSSKSQRLLEGGQSGGLRPSSAFHSSNNPLQPFARDAHPQSTKANKRYSEAGQHTHPLHASTMGGPGFSGGLKPSHSRDSSSRHLFRSKEGASSDSDSDHSWGDTGVVTSDADFQDDDQSEVSVEVGGAVPRQAEATRQEKAAGGHVSGGAKGRLFLQEEGNKSASFTSLGGIHIEGNKSTCSTPLGGIQKSPQCLPPRAQCPPQTVRSIGLSPRVTRAGLSNGQSSDSLVTTGQQRPQPKVATQTGSVDEPKKSGGGYVPAARLRL